MNDYNDVLKRYIKNRTGEEPKSITRVETETEVDGCDCSGYDTATSIDIVYIRQDGRTDYESIDSYNLDDFIADIIEIAKDKDRA